MVAGLGSFVEEFESVVNGSGATVDCCVVGSPPLMTPDCKSETVDFFNCKIEVTFCFFIIIKFLRFM
jgi:hypothetical protein